MSHRPIDDMGGRIGAAVNGFIGSGGVRRGADEGGIEEGPELPRPAAFMWGGLTSASEVNPPRVPLGAV